MGKTREIIKETLLLYREKRLYCVLYLAAALLAASMAYIEPALYQKLIDDVMIGGRLERLLFILPGFLGVFGLTVLFDYFKLYCAYVVRVEGSIVLKKRLFQNFFAGPVRSMDKRAVSEQNEMLESDAEFAGSFYEEVFVGGLTACLKIVAALVICFCLSLELSALVVWIIPLTIFADAWIAGKEKHVLEENRKNDVNLTAWLNETLTGWKEVKALQLERVMKNRFLVYLKAQIGWLVRRIYCFATRRLVIPYIKNKIFNVFIIYLVGGLLAIRGRMTIGEVLAYVSYFAILSSSVNDLSGRLADLKTKRDIMHNMFLHSRLVEEEGMVPERSVPFDTITLRELSFAWPSGKKVFDGADLTIHKPETVVIYGRSGEGKSTLALLMAGILKPDSGSICYGGLEVQKIAPTALYERLCYVSQDAAVFSGSFLDNFRRFSPSITEEEVRRLCALVELDEFISSLPDGYHTEIGQNGKLLSGGQRQRLLIARALTRRADIFLFDETFSSVENSLRNKILEALEKELGERIIIIVSHVILEQKQNRVSVEVADGSIRMAHEPMTSEQDRRENEIG